VARESIPSSRLAATKVMPVQFEQKEKKKKKSKYLVVEVEEWLEL
jgi:hypothetical protein